MNWTKFKESITDVERKLVDTYREIQMDLGFPKRILEVGSGWGLFTRSMLETPDTQVTTVDKIQPEFLKSFLFNTEGFDDRINMLTGESSEILPDLIQTGERFDLVMVDGSHKYEDVAIDLRLAWELADVVLVDDVFHKDNFVPNTFIEVGEHTPKDFEYGVAQALWEFMKLAKPEYVEFFPVGSGGLMLMKK